MNRLVQFIFSFCLLANLSAQTEVQILPSSLEYALTTDLSQPGTEAIARAIVINRSERTIDLAWEREPLHSPCPKTWAIRISDKVKYHSTSTYSNVTDGLNQALELYPGDSTVLDIHVLPNGISGKCHLEIELRDADDPKVVFQTASFSLTVNDYSAPMASRSGLRVFPNPTTHFFSIPNNDRVKKLYISNILGKRVHTFDTVFNGRYDLSTLPDGIYLVSMVDGQGKVLKTVRLSKRGIRP